MTGAQFEIRIDGTPRTYRDRKDFAMEAARFLKSKIRTGQGERWPSSSGLGSGIDKDRPDYTVYCGEWRVGRISSA